MVKSDVRTKTFGHHLANPPTAALEPDELYLRHTLAHILSSFIRYWDNPTPLHAHVARPILLQNTFPIGSLFQTTEPLGLYHIDCGNTTDNRGDPDRPLRTPMTSTTCF